MGRLLHLGVVLALLACLSLGGCGDDDGGDGDDTGATPTTTAETSTAQERTASLSDLLEALSTGGGSSGYDGVAASLSRWNSSVTGQEVSGVVQSVCSEGSSQPLQAFIANRLPAADLQASGPLNQLVGLVGNQCRPTAQQYSQLRGAVLSGLSFNGVRRAGSRIVAATELQTLRDRACNTLGAVEKPASVVANELLKLATRNRFRESQAVELAVTAAVKACPLYIGNLIPALSELPQP